MATVVAVYTVAPFARRREDFPDGLDVAAAGGRGGARRPRPRPRAKLRRRGPARWEAGVGSREWDPEEVTAQAMVEAEGHDAERAKRWVVLLGGTERRLDLVEEGAIASKSREVTATPLPRGGGRLREADRGRRTCR